MDITIRVHTGENSQKCLKVKPINNTLETQRIKLNSLIDFVAITSREIIDYIFNRTNIRTFEARNNYKMEISKRS